MRYDIGAGIAGLAFVLLGTAFLLDTLDVVQLRFEVILPIGAIVLGAGVILGSLLRPREP